MLDHFSIFTKGGMIMFSWSLGLAGSALRGNPIDALIRTILLEERGGEKSYNYTHESSSYTLKWTLDNKLGLVFVAVYQQFMKLTYIEEMLETVRTEFSSMYQPKCYKYPELDERFAKVLASLEKKAEQEKRNRLQTTRTFEKKSAKKEANGDGNDCESRADATDDDPAETRPVAIIAQSAASNGQKAGDDVASSSVASGFAFDKSKLARKKGVVKSPEVKAPMEKKQPKRKVGRKWDDSKDVENLDFSSKPAEGESERESEVIDKSAKSAMDIEYQVESSDDEEDAAAENESLASEQNSENRGAAGKKKSRGWLKAVMASSVVTSLVGKQALGVEDVQPILEQLRMNLMAKNVAEEIALKLCDSVAKSLEGRKLASFTSLAKIVKSAMEEALVRILTPRRSVDVLRDVQAARERGRPYSVVFIGVNGVGKSTNLAKVAYWLGQQDLKVMLCACDTFRAGAVEQLRTHGKRLNVPVFERGYEKDPSAVAAEGIKAAQKQKQDVVLIDTAGRMQDNEPLMRALSKLVTQNNPDLVLFVGEALVGNDAVDQLSKFNQALADLSTQAEPRLIDGILLTKFDTVDERVGAALSMVYTSGAPVMFVGCGQTYTDLRKLNPKQIVNTLLH